MLKFKIRKFFHSLISRRPAGTFVGRQRTHDVAFTFRMGAGFTGDVNRSHPASIEPALCDPTNPPPAYGTALLAVAGSQGVRGMLASDTAVTAIYGVGVRPYPQSPNTQTTFGSQSTQPFGTPPPTPNQPIDVLRSGYIMTKVSGSVAVAKGGAVFVWIAASAGSHVQGGFEASTTAGSTIALDSKTTWNGSADANGIAELAFNL
jgi:hypothetical protein